MIEGNQRRQKLCGAGRTLAQNGVLVHPHCDLDVLGCLPHVYSRRSYRLGVSILHPVMMAEASPCIPCILTSLWEDSPCTVPVWVETMEGLHAAKGSG